MFGTTWWWLIGAAILVAGVWYMLHLRAKTKSPQAPRRRSTGHGSSEGGSTPRERPRA